MALLLAEVLVLMELVTIDPSPLLLLLLLLPTMEDGSPEPVVDLESGPETEL